MGLFPPASCNVWVRGREGERGRAGGCPPPAPSLPSRLLLPLPLPPVLPAQIRQSLCGGGGRGVRWTGTMCPFHLSLPPSLPLSVTLPQCRSWATGLADAGSLIQTSKIKQLLASSGNGAMRTSRLATLALLSPSPHPTPEFTQVQSVCDHCLIHTRERGHVCNPGEFAAAAWRPRNSDVGQRRQRTGN